MSENQANLGDQPGEPGPDPAADLAHPGGEAGQAATEPIAAPGPAGHAPYQPLPAQDQTAPQQPYQPQPFRPYQQSNQPYQGYQPYPPAAPPPTPSGWRKGVIATVAAAVIAVSAGGVGGFVGYSLHGDRSPLQDLSSGIGQNSAPVIDRSSLAKIAAEVQPTVVVIQTNSGEGSGVIISTDGYIVTNNHVVASATGDQVRVTFNSGKRVPARIIGADAKTDIAVVKADNATGLKAASWGDSDAVQVGDTVLAIGSPLGLQGSVTAGIVSAKHRTITVGDQQQSPFDIRPGRTTIGDVIQTDAPINPGNSGGALVNTSAEVIGINSAIATSGSSGNIGVGFAIPANKAKLAAEQLIKGGKVSHPFLGVSVGDAENGGAQIQEIQPGGPAAKAGLRAGDVVIRIDDQTIASSEDLVAAVQAGTVGGQLRLTVVRNGVERTVTVTLAEAP